MATPPSSNTTASPTYGHRVFLGWGFAGVQLSSRWRSLAWLHAGACGEDEVRMVRLLARALRYEGRAVDGTEGLLLGALGEDL